MTTYSESYWKRREDADEERERAAVPLEQRPEYGPVEPPPPVPPDVAPVPPPPPEFASYAPSAPEQSKADDGAKAMRMQAIRELQRTASMPMGGPSDADIAAASQRDRERVQRSNLSEAIAAAFARRPARLQQEPSEVDALQSQRQSALSQRNHEMTLAGRMAKLMKGGDDDDDGSLAERRRALTEEGRNRLRLSQLQLEAAERERERRGGQGDRRLDIDEKKIAEDTRHHMATEKKPGGPHPVSKVKAGDIATVPEQYREVVKAIADGRMEAPKAASRFGADVLKYVVAYKPDFDATRFGNYAAVSKQQATAPDIVAMDVGRHHLKIAKSLIPKGADVKYFNRLKQAFAAGSGDPEFVAFNTAANVSAHELARMMKIDDQQGKQMVEHMLAPVQSEQQLIAVFDTFDRLIEGKQEGLAAQLERYLPDSVRKKRETERTGGDIKTRPMKNGGTAYQGVKTGKWFTTEQEAQAN